MIRQTSMNLGPDDFLTTAEVAQILNVSKSILRSWRTVESVGPPYMKFGKGAIRYRRSDVDAYIEKAKQ